MHYACVLRLFNAIAAKTAAISIRSALHPPPLLHPPGPRIRRSTLISTLHTHLCTPQLVLRHTGRHQDALCGCLAHFQPLLCVRAPAAAAVCTTHAIAAAATTTTTSSSSAGATATATAAVAVAVSPAATAAAAAIAAAALHELLLLLLLLVALQVVQGRGAQRPKEVHKRIECALVSKAWWWTVL